MRTYQGKPVVGQPDNLAYYVKWRKARHGHYIVYRLLHDGTVYIVRILHGSMDFPRRLS
jgi:plasmid stabilization system protein ParE